MSTIFVGFSGAVRAAIATASHSDTHAESLIASSCSEFGFGLRLPSGTAI